MSNYYYEEKVGYLNALAGTRAAGHDLTPFLKFALKGIESQCRRLLSEIRLQVEKALYRNTVRDLFGRLKSPRRRVMSDRHVQLLNLLLDEEEMNLGELAKRTTHFYSVKNPYKALTRDLRALIELEAISAKRLPEGGDFLISIRLEWPTKITDTEFFRRAKAMPKAKIHGFLST
jgi:predicted transcriptional regulator